MSNLYDDIAIDIEKAHELLNANSIECSNRESYLGLAHKFLYKLKLYNKFVDAGLIRYWFNEFSEYWSSVLKGRPLQLHDFFYLYSSYRTKFQYISVKENASKQEFLYAWQRYENIYLTLSCVYKNALQPFLCYHFLPFLKMKRRGNILEYGCGIAPIITSMIKCKMNKYQFTIADIRNYTYHYAKYRLKQHGVKTIDIMPSQAPYLEDKYDVIFLINVLEHLPAPAETVEALTGSLNKGGFLIFDYILSKGEGLDTLESVKQRKQVLSFINDNYRMIKGEPKYNESMGIIIVQKA
ncbi:MAG: class I SAM-dependent methyltransferase [Candidatus Omnitrophica bacterium]|nr:class I SAM-dependent methyltransferase [Candidatus Omnitrophota bacterium]